MTVNVLGTDYKVEKRSYTDDEVLSKRKLDGYCDPYMHLVVYCDADTLPGWEDEDEITKRESEKETVRHELVHAFLYESGLAESSHGIDHGWARDEEIVDWIAAQGVKICKAWQEAGAI